MPWGLNQYRLAKIPIKRVCDGYYLRWYYNGWHYWFFLPGKIAVQTKGEEYRTISTRKLTIGTGQVTYDQVTAIRTIMNTREVYLLQDGGWANLRVEPGSIQVYNNYVNGYDVEITVLISAKSFSPLTWVPVEPPGPDPDICDLPCIGTQIWMCKNYDSLYPGSKTYQNDELFRPIYGGLYTWAQVMAAGFCPVGYHVPTMDEWTTLINEAGGLAVAGGVLKEVGTTHWVFPNTDAVDTYGFTALPGGMMFGDVPNFLGGSGWFWTASPWHSGEAKALHMDYDSGAVTLENWPVDYFLSVRLIKDTPCIIPPYTGYGALYNWYAVDTGFLAPTECHVPTGGDWGTLITFLGGVSVAGGHLKETGLTYWNTPNTGADNSSGFTAKGAGFRADNFYGLKTEAYFWTKGGVGPGINGVMYWLGNTVETFENILTAKYLGCSVRCLLDDPGSWYSGMTIADIDGNVYHTVQIGTQVWLVENLRVTKLNDGTPIPEVTDNATWIALVTPGRCWYNNTP